MKYCAKHDACYADARIECPQCSMSNSVGHPASYVNDLRGQVAALTAECENLREQIEVAAGGWSKCQSDRAALTTEIANLRLDLAKLTRDAAAECGRLRVEKDESDGNHKQMIAEIVAECGQLRAEANAGREYIRQTDPVLRRNEREYDEITAENERLRAEKDESDRNHKRVIAETAAECGRLRAQRDALLAAVELTIGAIPSPADPGCDCADCNACRALRAAVAACEHEWAAREASIKERP